MSVEPETLALREEILNPTRISQADMRKATRRPPLLADFADELAHMLRLLQDALQAEDEEVDAELRRQLIHMKNKLTAGVRVARELEDSYDKLIRVRHEIRETWVGNPDADEDEQLNPGLKRAIERAEAL